MGSWRVFFDLNLAIDFKNCALIVDSTSIEIQTPGDNFEDSKKWYDGKNEI